MPSKLPSSFKTLICVAVGLIGLAVLAIGLTIVALRNDATNDAVRDSGNIATIFAEQTAHAVQSLDTTLTALRDHFTALGTQRPGDLRRLAATQATFSLLLDRLTQMPQADVITIVDDQGQMVTSTRRWPPLTLNFSDRDYFRHLKDNADARLYVSLPVAARATRLRSFWLLQPLTET